MVWRVVTGWKVPLLAFAAVAMWWALQVLPPASYYFDANHMMVPDAPEGAEIALFVDREIKRPAYGRWTVTVRRYDGSGWTLACAPSRGSSDYMPDASLPDPLTLYWWTDGQCRITKPGRYFITTTWAFEPRRLSGVRRTRPLVSNIFTIADAGGASNCLYRVSERGIVHGPDSPFWSLTARFPCFDTEAAAREYAIKERDEK